MVAFVLSVLTTSRRKSRNDMLESLHHTIRVLTQASGATQADMLMLKTRFPLLPGTLSDLMLDATELELSYGGRYLRLYGPHGCIEWMMRMEYRMPFPTRLQLATMEAAKQL